jgi:predicted nuclease with TOPRIM domain
LTAELDASQREHRSAGTEAFRLRAALDEASEQLESVRRENKTLAQELKDLTDQLGEGDKSVHEQVLYNAFLENMNFKCIFLNRFCFKKAKPHRRLEKMI